MTEQGMFEQSFKRPKYFFNLSDKEQWNIDSSLGLLDWKGQGLSNDDLKRFKKHYKI
jgi:hypothetical protein